MRKRVQRSFVHPFLKHLLMHCAHDVGAQMIIRRALRAVADFEYEYQMVE